jgi:outer membrane murein-binding lipoprotein Lpp
LSVIEIPKNQEKIEKRTQKQEEKSEVEGLKAKIAQLESDLKVATKDAEDFKTLLIKAQQENVELRKRLKM